MLSAWVKSTREKSEMHPGKSGSIEWSRSEKSRKNGFFQSHDFPSFQRQRYFRFEGWWRLCRYWMRLCIDWYICMCLTDHKSRNDQSPGKFFCKNLPIPLLAKKGSLERQYTFEINIQKSVSYWADLETYVRFDERYRQPFSRKIHAIYQRELVSIRKFIACYRALVNSIENVRHC